MPGILKAQILGTNDDDRYDAAGRSTQLPEDTWDYDKTGAKEPPYSLDALALFLEINTWHFRCVKSKAVSTAGLGFDFVVPDGIENPDDKNKAILKNFFNFPNSDQTWSEILENVLTDFEALGNGYFEIVRNRFGLGAPKAIYHIPAVTMRVRKDKKGFIQQRDNKLVYFRGFATDPKIADSYDPRDKDKPLKDRRLLNEVIHLKNYHPRSSYYGLPDFLPALRALVGNKKAGDFNISFFENNAVPQYAIIVKGGELAKGTRKRIEEYFRTHIKGQAHKTLILEVVQEEGQTVDIEIKPLSVEIKDASFRMFRTDNAEEIRVSHGVPGRLIGLTEQSGLGGAGEGTSQQEIFKYHVIEPKQTRLEFRINNFLIKQGFNIHDWELKFKEIDVTDEGKVADIVEKLVRLGVITINEGRKMCLQKPLKHPGADVPFIMSSMGPLGLDTLVEGGVRPQMLPLTAPSKNFKLKPGAEFVKAAINDLERFQRLYQAALLKVLSGQYSKFEAIDLTADLENILKEAERILGKEPAQTILSEAKEYLSRAFKSGLALRSGVSVSLALPHQQAIDWLVNHDHFWLGNVFPNYLREPFKAAIVQGLKDGLGRKEIGANLKALLFGKDDVPGKVELYTRVVSASVSRARNWGSMFSLRDAGVETYTWQSAADERTCLRCLDLHGRQFSVPKMMEIVDTALKSAPQDIETISPWPSEDKTKDDYYLETASGRRYLKEASSSELSDLGIGLPPIHPACRCVVLAD